MALESDLADGLVLIALVEVLSGKRLPKHNKRANLKAQKLENINIALKFLQVEEKIKIVNIGEREKSQHITRNTFARHIQTQFAMRAANVCFRLRAANCSKARQQSEQRKEVTGKLIRKAFYSKLAMRS